MCAGGVAWLSEEWGSPVPLPLGQATPTRAPKIALMPPPHSWGPWGWSGGASRGGSRKPPPRVEGPKNCGRVRCCLTSYSSCWGTEAMTSPGPDLPR